MDSLIRFLKELPAEQKQHGGHPERKKIKLSAGDLSMIYQNGSLRYISVHDHEVIRMIYSAVRVKNWLTVEPVITGEVFEIHHRSFKIEYDCLYDSDDINFLAHYTIEGRSDNSVVFTLNGIALKSFEKNRIGFCLLHPVEGCAGETCEITHSNNETEVLEFPYFISPHQPFRDIRSMNWKAGKNFCRIDFLGDIFETEDQRNWTDASYKTYCTPLDLPFPVRIEKGMKISQSIVLGVKGSDLSSQSNTEWIDITFDPRQKFDIPLIGVGRSSRSENLSDKESGTLKNVRVDHYRVDLYLFNSDWSKIAECAAAEAQRLEYCLELALFFDDNAADQAAEFINWSSIRMQLISTVLLFHGTELSTPEYFQETVTPLLKYALPGVKIGIGTNANFAELNRGRPGPKNYDYLCYSIHPQEHAADNETLVENLHQGYSVESARRFAGGKGIWISPVNIKRRFNANFEAFENHTPDVDFPPQADSRLMTLFGACWTAGSIKYLAEAGVKGITYFETTGERGIIQGDHDSRWPLQFMSVRGMIFPVYHLLRYLLRDRSFRLMRSSSSQPLHVDCLTLSDGTMIKTILVNFTSLKKEVIVHGLAGMIAIKQLDAETYIDSAINSGWIDSDWKKVIYGGESLILSPYSINFIESNAQDLSYAEVARAASSIY
jgi:D-apionolactonase